MATRRHQAGQRRDTAIIERYEGPLDEYGQPMYSDPQYWERVCRWPCEFLGAKGGEFTRGRQVTAQSTHVLYGDYMVIAKKEVSQRDRIRIRGKIINILDVTDLHGDMREIVIDAKAES